MYMTTLIKNGLVYDMVTEAPYVGDVLLKDGKIAKIGQNISDETATVIDATDKVVLPGLIDCHCHLGLDGYGIGFEGQDYNELNDVQTPQLRAIDSFNPMDPTIKMAALGGVTTVATGQGSSNAVGGTWLAVKTDGICVDDMVVKDPIAMKCALGENPKRIYKGKNNYARMSTAFHIREMIIKAIDYKERKAAAGDDVLKRPTLNLKLEAMLPVINKEIPLKIHAHQANDIITAIRLAKEFGLRMTLEHVTEGHLIADVLAAHKEYPLAIGPTLTHATKFELQNKTWETPGILAKKGCQVSIITDSPVIPQQYLGLCAGLAVKAGMDEMEALRAITINPAKHISIDDRVGSLAVGKDADVVIFDKLPLFSDAKLEHVFINGKEVK